MKVRVQLVENNPLHCIPSIFLNIHRTQFIFNVIPSLVRHRKKHKLNLHNSSFIFFTKNSIQAFGGLPNFLLFRSGVQNSNPTIVNKINIFGDGQLTKYLEQLRYKLGYKCLRFSYTNWQSSCYRFGLSSYELFTKISKNAQLPKLFAKIEQYILKIASPQEYYDSRFYISSQKTKYMNVKCSYYHSKLIDIYPMIVDSDGVIVTNYICIFPIQRKGIDVNLQKFIQESGITKQSDINNFFKGKEVSKNGKIYKKENFLYQTDVKPKNIMILHHSSPKGLQELTQNIILKNYFQNNNQTGLIIHIVQELQILETIIFKKLMKCFGKNTKHLWFNNKLQNFSGQQIQTFQQNLLLQSIWNQFYPSKINNLLLQRLKYYHLDQQDHKIIKVFETSSFLYKRIFNYIKNDYLGDKYQLRIETEPKQDRLSIIKRQLSSKLKQQQKILSSQVSSEKSKIQFEEKVIFLGTASSMSTIDRNTSGILVKLCENHSILLDCGQQSFEQMVNHFPPQQIKEQLMKIKVIFITHIHSDHNLGILNLISERKKIMKKIHSNQKVFLIIPFNIFHWYHTYNTIIENLTDCCQVLFSQVLLNEPLQNLSINSNINSNLNFQQCNNSDDKFFAELQISSKTKQLVQLQLSNQKKVFNQFKSFLQTNHYQSFTPIRVIHCPQSFGIVISNNKSKVSYSGDTRPSDAFTLAAKNSDIMIHQATFNNEDWKKAQQFRHSTIQQAVQVGINSNSKKLILTHFQEQMKSPEVQNSSLIEYFNKHTLISFDHLQVKTKQLDQQLPQLSKFIFDVNYRGTKIHQQIKKSALKRNDFNKK